MGTVNVTLGDGEKLNLVLGQQLENAVTAVVFNFSAWKTEFGSGTLGLSVQRHGDDQPYAVVPTVSGNNATWNISELDTAYKGVGEVQVTYTVGSVVKKSTVYKFTVYRSLGENGEYPSPGQTWQEEIEDELADVKQDLENLSGLSDEAKEALLACFRHLAFLDDDDDYYGDLYDALYPPTELSSITAVYTQSGTVYTTDSIDSLKNDLVVTAHYSDSSSETVTTYTLSGTLTEGTSTITVSYGGKTTTFNVTVSAPATLSSISATYTQTGTVYDTDLLDSLKADLVVVATYSDSSTRTVSDYTLSGTLTAGTSTITVTYEGKTDTFTVTVTHETRTLLRNWDFTQSLIDSVQGATATISGTGIERTSAGVVFNGADQRISIPDDWDMVGKSIEVDVASFSFQGSLSYHIRFLLLNDGSASYGWGPIIYHSTGEWAAYGAGTSGAGSNGKWSSAWSASLTGTTSEVLNAFNGKTVKVEFENINTTSLYLDDVLAGTITDIYLGNTSRHKRIFIGSTSGNDGASKGNQCYNMTISALRIYENEE